MHNLSLSDQILIYLHKNLGSHDSIFHHRLFAVFASRYSNVDQNNFAIAIKYLIYRSYIIQDVDHYRIIPAGRHQAGILTGAVTDPATETRRLQNEANIAVKRSSRFKTIGVIITAFIAVLSFMINSSGSLDTFSLKSLSSTIEKLTMQDNFAVGDKANILTNSKVELRVAPGLSTKPQAGIPRYFTANDNVVFTIIAGPRQKDGLSWWKVTSNIEDGWVAEYATDGTRLLGKI